jgi:uncharacterized SAM-binding protein YcdF (DUF218 family)
MSKELIRKILRRLFYSFRIFFLILGLSFFTMIVLSFTDLPYLGIHWLGTHECKTIEKVDYVILMGAGGMPGPESLLRCYYTAQLADSFPDSKVIVAFPVDDEANYQGSENESLALELVRRGIDPNRIIAETNGTNTYTQAEGIMNIIKDPSVSLVIVSSPEHIYRCIRTFRKQGFQDVNGLPTFEQSTDDKVFYTKTEKKDKDRPVERNLMLRYNMWGYLQYEIIFLRECVAITYYKLNGYI